MLALRLTRTARLAVHLRRLLVAVASAGTGFLLLCALGYALSHPDTPGAAALRLAWCVAPLAAAVHLAVAVARTDPGTRPRSGLSAIGLGPGRLMAVSATTTALAAALGSVAALLLFLHLRGDLTGGRPSGRVAADALAVGQSLPAPAVLTLLVLGPAFASAAVAHSLRPREPRPAAAAAPRGYGRFGAYGWGKARETFGAYGRFGSRAVRPATAAGSRAAGAASAGAGGTLQTQAIAPEPPAPADVAPQAPGTRAEPPPPPGHQRSALGFRRPRRGPHRRDVHRRRGHRPRARHGPLGRCPDRLGPHRPGSGPGRSRPHPAVRPPAPGRPPPRPAAAGRPRPHGGVAPHRPPLGVVAAVAAAAYVAGTVYAGDGPAFGPLSTLGALLVAGCTVAALLTAAVEAKHARADTTQALLRLGAPPATLRGAAAVRAAALLALFGPLTLVVAVLAALPLAD